MAEFPVSANTSKAVAEINELIAAIRKAGKEAGLTEKQIDEMVQGTEQAGRVGSKNIGDLNTKFNTLGGTIKTVGTALGTLVALDQLKAFGGEVIRVTSEFQRLEAVLTNSLGSRSEAQRALATIQQIASKTPFSVLQLTESYVKLVNQGFKPTAREITKLGDLAASTGKQFDQLTEAIIDAQTGEFERLKEFGIRASKEGDRVTFTFKGVQQQVDFTNAAIRNYILSLGDAEGVSGSMAAISETLGGRISNLGDAWDQFLNTLGGRTDGVFANVIAGLQDILGLFTDLAESDSQKALRETNQYIAEQLELVRAAGDAVGYTTALRQELVIVNKQLADAEKELATESAKTVTLRNGRELSAASIPRVNELQKQIDLQRALAKAIEEEIQNETQLAQQKADNSANDARAKKLAEEKKAYEQLLKERKKFIDSFLKENTSDPETSDAFGGIAQPSFLEQYRKQLNDDTQRTKDKLKESYDRDFQNFTNSLDAKLKAEQEHNARRREALDTFQSYTISAIEEVFNARVNSVQREQALLDQQYQYEMSLAGDNKDAQLQIRNEFNKRSLELQNKENQRKREASVFDILINQGPAIAKTAASLPFPLVAPFIAAVVTLFGLQLSRTRSIPVPRFAAEGEFDIDGPGTETSDSIPYFLSRRETVVPARGTKKFPDLLREIVENPNLDWYDIRNIVDKNLATDLRAPIVVSASSDNDEIKQELKAIRQALENRTEEHFHWDENGFHKSVKQKNMWTKYLNAQHR